MARRRRNELLTAGCDKPNLMAERDTLCSVSSTCNTRSREVSIGSRCRSIGVLCREGVGMPSGKPGRACLRHEVIVIIIACKCRQPYRVLC